MACLSSLPNELLIDIFEYSQHIRTLKALSATSKRLHYVANPILYSRAVRKHPYLLTWACEFDRLDVVQKLLAVGMSPNMPAYGNIEPRYMKDHDLTDPMKVLDRVYLHQISNKNYYYDDDRHLPDIYDSDSDPQDYSSSIERTVRKILSNTFVHEWNGEFWFPLHAASMSGSLEIIKTLINAGARLDVPSQKLCTCSSQGIREIPGQFPYWTPLHTALCCGNEDVANLLLRSGCSMTVELPYTRLPTIGNLSTSLHWAARGGNMATMNLLLGDTKTNIDVPDGGGATPLIWALGTTGGIPTIHYLFSQGANIDAQVTDISRYRPGTALTIACRMGWHQEANLLIDAGANIHIRPPGCPSALEQCLIWFGGCASRTEFSDWEYVEGAGYLYDLYHKSERRKGKIALQAPMKSARDASNRAAMLELVWRLIRNGANIRGHPDDEYSLLTRASRADLLPVVDYLLSSGVDVNPREVETSPLLAAVVRFPKVGNDTDHYQTIEHLLKHGADPNQMNDDGSTPLTELCNRWRYSGGEQIELRIARLLLSYGADINVEATVRNQRGNIFGYYPFSPLEIAIQRNKWELSLYLGEQGAKIFIKPEDRSNLHLERIIRSIVHSCPQHCGEKDEEGSLHDFSIDPDQCPAIFCRMMRLLNLDETLLRQLATNSSNLYTAVESLHFPLAEMLLNARAELGYQNDGISCVDRLIKRVLCSHAPVNTDLIQRLIDSGVDINGGRREEILDILFQYAEPCDYFADGGVERFISLLTVLVKNEARISSYGMEDFKILFSGGKKRRNRTKFGSQFQRDLSKELKRRFIADDGWIVARERQACHCGNDSTSTTTNDDEFHENSVFMPHIQDWRSVTRLSLLGSGDEWCYLGD
ncbi:ankyrin repeat-containing domain protein [Hypomontagnella monticulosa]|nr:ankyrin repeat-containing domain protein [Hypomontagnella monticulosa]